MPTCGSSWKSRTIRQTVSVVEKKTRFCTLTLIGGLEETTHVKLMNSVTHTHLLLQQVDHCPSVGKIDGDTFHTSSFGNITVAHTHNSDFGSKIAIPYAVFGTSIPPTEVRARSRGRSWTCGCWVLNYKWHEYELNNFFLLHNILMSNIWTFRYKLQNLFV